MNQSDPNRNANLLRGSLTKKGYMRWWHSFTGVSVSTQKKRIFFIEYLIMNPALGSTQPILGQHPFFKKQHKKPSYVMIKAGVFPDEETEGLQLHAFYPVSSLKVAQKPLYIQVEDCVYSENRIFGSIEVTDTEASHPFFFSDAGCMEWDLEVHKALSCHTGAMAGPLACALNALDSFWHGEGILTSFSGSITLNGELFDVIPTASYGYADKHWGRSFNRPWLQLASCHLISERTGKELKYSALAVDGCCPRFLWFPLRQKLTIQLTYTGEDYEFSFARPGQFSRCKWKTKETNKRLIWHIKAQNKKSLIKISMNCKKEQMLPLLYENPDGTMRKSPLFAGGEGIGTIELYSITPEGKKHIDTLTVKDALCEFQADRG